METKMSEENKAVEVKVINNGPYIVNGKIVIKDAQGNVIKEADRCTLCSCGKSGNMPFCDGSHAK